MTPVVAKNTAQVLTRNVPIKVRNSPMNPDVPGSPTLAKVKIMKATA